MPYYLFSKVATLKKTENDPDILQYMDETNTEWTKLWTQKTSSKQTIHFTITMLQSNLQEIIR
jgi:hypothetical protein